MTKLCPRGKSAAKRKFKVYPSAYANAYASKICAGKIKDPSGVKRKDFKGPKPAAEGAMMNKPKKAAIGAIALGAGLLGAKKFMKKKSSKMLGMDDIKPGETVAELYKKKMQGTQGPIKTMNKGGLKAELNNPAKGYTAGGMADYYKDLM